MSECQTGRLFSTRSSRNIKKTLYHAARCQYPAHRRDTGASIAASNTMPACAPFDVRRLSRSEEHTSELQSLMRISYAVFCLKKKNTNMHCQIEEILLDTEHSYTKSVF